MRRPRTFQDVSEVEVPELTFFQKFKLRFSGYVFIGFYRLPGWGAALPFYAFKCKEHGLQVSYPHGYDEMLQCKVCYGQSSQDEG